MKYYIAYGSNLNIGQMQFRCPTATPVGTAMVPGYRLFYKGSKTGAYLTLRKSKSGKFPAAIWAVTDEDEKALDRYEGFPTFYYKKEMPVKVFFHGGKIETVTAFVYIMRRNRKPALPSPYYIAVCERGYKDFGFSPRYLDEAYELTLKLCDMKKAE